MLVRRAALRMWLVALAGIPLLVIAADFFLQRRLLGALQEALFPADDPQRFEPRDWVWAGALLAAGVGLAGWGLKELIAPRKVLQADDDGLWLSLAGPFRSASYLPWEQVVQVAADQVGEAGTTIPVLVVTVEGRGSLPSDPWGARWKSATELAVSTEDWEVDAEEVAAGLERLRPWRPGGGAARSG